MAPSRTERLLDGDPTSLSLDELRSRRALLVEEEVGLSYLRRLVQGRMDIVAAAGRRATMGDLVDELPSILADRTHAPGHGRLPQVMAPSEEDEARLEAELDAVVPASTLTDLDTLGDGELATLAERLTAFEHDVSARRRDLHARIDALQSELTRRYKTGEADVESLLT